MIYLASRSHPKYLRALRDVACRPSPHHIVSISGGLAFLHALSDQTRSLVLVDSDTEVNTYVSQMIEVLITCSSRRSFFQLLSGHCIEADDSRNLTFTNQPWAGRHEALSQLTGACRKVVTTCYPADAFDAATATIGSALGTVHFVGLNLEGMHFNWMCGFGAFESEASYTVIRNALIRTKPQIHTMELEAYPYASCPPGTLILASNTDSPLFTRNDSVLEAIERSGSNTVHYLSRTRDFSRESLPISSDLTSLALRPVAVGFSDGEMRELSELYPFAWKTVSAEGYGSLKLYDEELVAFRMPPPDPEVLRLVDRENPIHQRVMVVTSHLKDDQSDHPEWLRRYDRASVRRTSTGIIELFELRQRNPY